MKKERRKGEALRMFSYRRSRSMSGSRSGNEKAFVDSEIYYVRGLSRRWQKLLKLSGWRWSAPILSKYGLQHIHPKSVT